MVLILYGFVVFLATLLGSFVGLGGGVIIKPVLDVINAHSLTEISFFSSCAVFAMSITSTTRHIIKKTPIKPSIVLLVALGSVGGGLLGNYLFNYFDYLVFCSWFFSCYRRFGKIYGLGVC